MFTVGEPDARSEEERIYEAEQRAYWLSSPPPIRTTRVSRMSNAEWSERVKRMWNEMPAHLQQKVWNRVLEDNPRLIWMTMLSILDAAQDQKNEGQDQGQV